LTPSSLSDGFWERTSRLTSLRHSEQEQMQQYVGLTSGHMEFLIRALDGNPTGVRTPDIPDLSVIPDLDLIREAEEFLHCGSLPIEPRKMWPPGGLPLIKQRGAIRATSQAQTGRALCAWGDPVWGELIRRGKSKDKRFADELVDACAKLVREWNPEPFPTWVTCIPSRNHPGLVPDFAQRLAASLGLPFHGVIEKTADRPNQKTMANSSQQARNVDGSIAIIDETIPDGPVLLIDDMVDSRWTFTVAAWLLRSHGSGEVFPLALANTAHNE
jgi:ATP-dependent DNA helicase RecQ